MSGSILSGLLGGDTDGPQPGAAPPDSASGADPYVLALATEQSRQDPNVAFAVRTVLQKQARFIDDQVDQLEKESAIRLQSLRGQAREGAIRRMGLRIRVGMQIFTALAMTCIGAGLLIMLVDAFRSHSVIVEAFDAPPALAASGYSGTVVATGVLDGLQKLADATRGSSHARDTRNAWSSNVEIQVPATGISVSEIQRVLHARFGNDIHISGNLVEAAGGLILTVRGDSVPPRSFAGGINDLPVLTTRAAEYVYGSSQPAQFITYLINNGRNEDALAFLPSAFAHADTDKTRSFYANAWGNALVGLNRPAQGAAKYGLAIALDPHNWLARTNLPAALVLTEGEESAWKASMALLKAAADAPAGERPESRFLVNAGEFTWDLPLERNALLADAAHNAGAGSAANPDGPQLADVNALMHDPVAAARYLDGSDPADPTVKAEALLLQAYAALDAGNPGAAVAPMAAFWAAWQADPNLQSSFVDHHCFYGLALGMAGRMQDAESFFQKAGPWSRCYAFHGDILAHAGDLAAAQRLWADGVRHAPDLPTVYLHRGLNALSRRDFAAADADFAQANRGAPHYADPLKAWGDSLMQQGRTAEASAKYALAARYAPEWREIPHEDAAHP